MAAFSAGCDLGEPESQPSRGPDLHVIATFPKAGQGLECAPGQAGCGVPTNVEIEIALDRFLWPAGAPTRQSIKIFSGNEQNRTLDLEPEYDVVGRVLKFRLVAGLFYAPSTLYTVEIIQAPETGGDGLRAYDGAPLRPGPVPLKFSFFTASDPGPTAPAIAQPACADVVALFSSCTFCHTGRGGYPPAPMGMNFDNAAQITLTVVGQPAHQADVGPRAGKVLTNPPRVGVGMPRIDPRFPGNSFLLYKLVRNPQNYQRLDTACIDSATRLGLSVEQRCGPPSAAEISGLREWFVRGDPMPLDVRNDAGVVDLFLERTKMMQIQEWIRGGATCL